MVLSLLLFPSPAAPLKWRCAGAARPVGCVRFRAPARFAPMASTRLTSLDLLRGCALAGMIVVHFHIHTIESLAGLNDIIRTLVWRLVEEKSHGTFALLFGAGFALMMRNAEARGAPFVRIYLRRLAALAGFGFIAHAGFGFNVLIGYAVWGVPLLFIRRWSTRSLIALAIASAGSVALYAALRALYWYVTLGPEGVEAAGRALVATGLRVNEALDGAEAGTSYTALLAARLDHMAWFYRQAFAIMPGATLTLFITGMLFLRHGLFERPLEHVRVIVGMMIFGLLSWLAEVFLDVPFLGLIRGQWLTFTYVGGALLLLARRPVWQQRLFAVGQAGRMALTNYLAQIAVVDLLFSGYAVGLPPIHAALGLVLAMTLFAALAAFSVWWLRRFRYGPAEWLWRALTYGGQVALRRERPAIAR
jgi:uncharacterized protein